MSSGEITSTHEYRSIEKLTHGNYHTWAPRVTAELMKLGVWRFCTGEEIMLPKPTQPPSGTTPEAIQLNREYKEDVRYYNEATRRNDKATGTINSLIEPEQLKLVEKCTTAKEVWDTLKKKHETINSGLAVYYTKVGMLEKKYVEGDMHAHLSFLSLENHKLGSKAFDDEFLAQLMLMSLPRDSTWETLVVAQLQGATDTSPLKSIDIEARLMQEYRRVTEIHESQDSAMVANSHTKRFTSGTSKSKKTRCKYCRYLGHTEEDCRKRKAAEGSGSNNSRNKGKGKARAHVASTSDSDSDDENAAFASIHYEFPSNSPKWDDDSLHVFLAHDVVAFLSKTSDQETYIDSGSSRHLSPRREWFSDDTYTPLEKPINIHLGDASVIKAIGKGTLQYLMDTPNAVVPAAIPDALYVPGLAASLLSVARFTDRKHELRFKDSDCFILAPSGRCVAAAKKTTGGLYRLCARPMLSKEYANLARSSRTFDINILHRRLGHLGYDNVKRLIAKDMVVGVDKVEGRIVLCEACIHGKQHRFPFPLSNKKARHKLDLIHSDVCGPLPLSIGGKRYFITFIDDNTRYLWIYLIRHKSEAYHKFKEFKVMVENQSGLRIKVLRSDGGGRIYLPRVRGIPHQLGYHPRKDSAAYARTERSRRSYQQNYCRASPLHAFRREPLHRFLG